MHESLQITGGFHELIILSTYKIAVARKRDIQWCKEIVFNFQIFVGWERSQTRFELSIVVP